jgi:Concanavalin A-like lectin/glucanases superfamily/F5/8 type C domain
MRVSANRRRGRVAIAVAVVITVAGSAGAAHAKYRPGMPPNIDPGTPTYAGSETPVPDEPVTADPRKSALKAIENADFAAGGTSFWIDRVLERPFLSNQDSYLYTRGRALYMYTHQAGQLGFAGGYAYRERPTGGNQSMFTVTVSDATLSEVTAQRRQQPSHWASEHAAAGLAIAQRKFITYNNVAVTVLKVTNTGDAATTRTVTAASPIATVPAAVGTELTGAVTARYGLTTVTPRLSGDGMAVSGTTLTRTITLEPGASITFKVQLGATTDELPDSTTEYERYRGYDAETAFLAHVREYNRWWAENVPYIDVPDQNVKKMAYYRTFLNRYNEFDGNIPGNDYQFPVSIEGVLGYNNAIQLTQPMHMQDLKYFRNPLYAYGNWVSSGESSKCTAFTDNPGNTANWNNTYEQYIAREGWNAYKVFGGDKEILRNFARYAECDVKGQLAKYDGNGNNLIAYGSGALTGNDADAVALAFYGGAQDRTESAFWYSGAKAAAAAYAEIGEHAKAEEMEGIAQDIKDAILGLLWDDRREPDPGNTEVGRVPGQFGNALRLGPVGQFVAMPTGIVSALNDFTISAWVNPAAVNAWARVFDFGTGTQVNMFLTVSAGGGPPRFAITTGGGGAAEQVINATQPLPANQWTHFAVTLQGNTGTLYVNGQPVGTNTNMTLRPSSLGQTPNNWIGRSQYPDPNFNGTVDDFQIYDRALSAAEVVALGSSPGAGNVASYKFDEESGTTAVDSSGNGRDGTVGILTSTAEGKVFKQRDVARDVLVPWKDQQNFSPFTEGLVPNTDKYRIALRFYADREEFPIMPFYTANQRDKEEAESQGRGGSNNFSNINSTLQAQLYAKAMRDYPSEYITPDMYRKLLEWLTWTQYVSGNNFYPDNNEFFFNWNPDTQTLGRSGIHHNILGAYNFMIIDDIAGMRPRLDDVIELWPIDVGYDHFQINNLRYHDSDLTIVWDRPGDGERHYGGTPEGYSVYLDGRRAFTVDDLAHVTWSADDGRVRVLDGSRTRVLYRTRADLEKATKVRLADNARLVDAFQKTGLDLTEESGKAVNLAEGKPVIASFTTTTPSVQATAPENAVDGFTISGLPIQQGSYIARNPIWGTLGSPNAEDWFEVDLEAPTRFDTVRLYFYSNKNFGVGGNTYRQPASYTVQYHDGSSWVDVPQQVKRPSAPAPNYNEVKLRAVTAQRVRILMTPTTGYGIGLKEVQILETGSLRSRDSQCRGTRGAVSVDDLRVPAGATCTLNGTRVDGSVRVDRGATLRAVGVEVDGSVRADEARAVNLSGSEVDGDVEVEDGGGARVETTRVDGDLTFEENDAPVTAAWNRVDGSVRAFENRGGVALERNDIDRNLECRENDPEPTGGGNVVEGRKRDQCARL